jgi:hypothetical protein
MENFCGSVQPFIFDSFIVDELCNLFVNSEATPAQSLSGKPLIYVKKGLALQCCLGGGKTSILIAIMNLFESNACLYIDCGTLTYVNRYAITSHSHCCKLSSHIPPISSWRAEKGPR